MKINDLIEEVYGLDLERCALEAQIDEKEIIVGSITERIDEIYEEGGQKVRDGYARARDKRRAVREEIAELRAKVRNIDASINSLKLQIEYGELEGG